MKVLVTQSCPALWDPVDCSPPGFSVYGILKARILEWVAIPFSSGSARPKDVWNLKCSPTAQLVKNPPAMQETWVWSLGWEDPLEKGKTTHSSILAWRIPWTIHGAAELDTAEQLLLSKCTTNWWVKEKRCRLTDTETKLVVTGREREEGKDSIGLGSKRYKLLCIQKAKDNNVQYREYSQYFIVTINGICL